jgi:hypothetical protein
VLDFVETHLGTRVVLEPVELKSLVHQLSATVLNIENSEGTLWSEDFRAIGENAVRQLQWKNYHPHLPCAQKIFSLIKNLPLTGFERSFRMAEQHLSRERFIAGLPRREIALADIQFIADQLEIPPKFMAALESDLAKCVFVHFGYEGLEDSSHYKIYLEFPKGQEDALPLYTGYKWSTSDPTIMTITNYRRVQFPDAEKLVDLMEKYLEDRPVMECVSALVAAATKRTPSSDLLLVDVADQSTPRHSFDLNLYSAGLRISDVTDTLWALSRHFGIDEPSMDATMAKAFNDELGHISGGKNRLGQPFLTLYHTCHLASS